MDKIKRERKTTDKFIEELKVIHDNLNYDMTEYTVWKEKVIIGDKYGYCSMFPVSLLEGYKPSIRSALNKTEYWINMVKEVHADLDLDYSKVEYINNYTKVIIGTKYGDVSVTPSNILNGGKFNILSAVNKTEYWINMAKEAHGDKYDYSKSVYTGNACKVIIICPTHGEFIQSSTTHTFGAQCPKCSNESLLGGYYKEEAERNKLKWLDKSAKVYTIRCWNSDEEFYKIGVTTTDIKTRFKKSYMPYEYEVVDIIETNLYDATYLERKMHEEAGSKYMPKLYFKGYTECFTSV